MGGAPRPGPSLLPVHGQPRLQGHTLRPSPLCCLAFLASASQPCSEEVSSDFRITAGIFPCLFYNRSVGGVASQRPAYFVRLHLERLPLGKSAEAPLALLYSQVSGESLESVGGSLAPPHMAASGLPLESPLCQLP